MKKQKHCFTVVPIILQGNRKPLNPKPTAELGSQAQIVSCTSLKWFISLCSPYCTFNTFVSQKSSKWLHILYTEVCFQATEIVSCVCNWYTHMGFFPKGTERQKSIGIPEKPACLQSGMDPQEVRSDVKMCTHLFIAAQFTVSKPWKWPTYPAAFESTKCGLPKK